ncbi:MAG: ATP-binding protein [Candidatus Binatia bacterium]
MHAAARDPTAALLQVAREISGRLDLGECLLRICEITRATLGADRTGIVLWSERKHGWVPVADAGTPPDLFAQFKGKTFATHGTSYLDQVATGEVVVLDRTHPAPMAQRLLAGLRLATQIVAPLTSKQKAIGLLLVSYESPAQLQREQLDVVHGIAQQATVAIEAARLFTNTQKEAAFRAALSDLTLALSREVDVDRMRERICEATQAMFAVETAVLGIVAAGQFSIRAASGRDCAIRAGHGAPLSTCPQIAAVLREGRPAYVNGIGRSSTFDAPIIGAVPAQSVLLIPLVPAHAAPGALLLMDTGQPDRFGVVHVEKAAFFAAAVTAWIENRQLLVNLGEERAKLAEQSVRLQGANATLTVRSEQVRQANRALEELIYVASHDLRAPLINLLGFAKELGDTTQRLREGANGSAPAALDDLDESVGFMRHSAARLGVLVDGLLDVSRCGTRPMVHARVDVSALVQTILAAQQFVISAAAIDVQVSPLPVVLADPVGLSQVFANLIDNAIKYMGQSPARRLEVGYCEGLEHRFFVRDTGPGISAADQQNIFGLFQRGSRPPAAPGEGIGLAVVRKIVERHGGSIWVESKSGKGAAFWFTLPHQPPQFADAACSDHPNPAEIV